MKPSHRHLRNLTDWEKKTGWKYSITCTNIPDDGIGGVPGSHCDQEELRDAEPGTLRYRIWHLPARLASHARRKVLAISTDWPWKDAFLTCWQRLCTLPAPT